MFLQKASDDNFPACRLRQAGNPSDNLMRIPPIQEEHCFIAGIDNSPMFITFLAVS